MGNPGQANLLSQFFLNQNSPMQAKCHRLSRDLNPGPLAPKARIIPLDH